MSARPRDRVMSEKSADARQGLRHSVSPGMPKGTWRELGGLQGRSTQRTAPPALVLSMTAEMLPPLCVLPWLSGKESPPAASPGIQHTLPDHLARSLTSHQVSRQCPTKVGEAW